jgi:predicted RNase H-like HicB family nuclease
MGNAEQKTTMPEMRYAVVLEPDEDVVRVVIPAFPEIVTFGSSEEHALEMARDAISLAIEHRHATGDEIPPSDSDTAHLARVTVNTPAA